MQHISVLIKPASGLCNMKCEYCFYFDELENRKQNSLGMMSEETLKNIIEKTLSQASVTASYVFQGGEPTLRGLEFYKLAIKLQRKYNKNNAVIYNALQTNGLLLDEEWCRFLKENNILVGISVDGNRDTHDRYRKTKSGKGTFDIVCDRIKLLEKYQVDYNILTVVEKNVAENISEIYELYRRKNWKFQQYIACMEPLRGVWGSNSYSLNPQLYGTFLITLFEMWYEDWKKGKQPYIRQFDNYIGILKGYMPEACEQCGFCNIQYAIEANGNVYPCDFYMLDEYCIGNFNHDSIDMIQKNLIDSGFLQRSRMISDTCRCCEYYYLCRGGCQRNRIIESDGTYINYFCKAYHIFFDYCIERMQQMSVK